MSRIIPAPIIGDNASSGAQIIDGSLKFQKANSTYLIRTPSSAGNRSVYTGSVWVKRTQFAPENNSNSNTHNHILFSAGTNTANNIDNIRFYKNAGSDSNAIEYGAYPGSYNYLVITNAKFRDPSGWYNVVWNYDGTTAKIYINGVQQTDLDTNTQNGGSNGHFNNTVAHVIGRTPDLAYNGEFDGYMSQFYWIDGLSLGPGYFGYVDPLTNTWRPKKFRAEGTTINDGRSWSGTSSVSNNNSNGNGAGSLANVFNGTQSGSSSHAYGFTTGAMDFTWTPNSPIPYGSIVRVWTGFSGGTVFLNGNEEVVSSQNNNWTTLVNGKSGSIQSVRFTVASGGGWWAGVEVDGVLLINSTTTNLDFGLNGFYLPMDGNSSIGKDLSRVSPINNGTTWSNSLTSTTGNFHAAPYGKTAGFNTTIGSGTGGYVQGASSAPNPNNLTFTCNIPFTSTVEVYLINNANTVTVNGGSPQSIAQDTFVTVATGPGTLTSLKFERPSTNGASFSAIKVDGVLLVDGEYGNSWTPVNFNGTDSNPDVVKDSPSGPAFGGPPTSGITTTNSPPANYATWNPLKIRGTVTLSDGNLKASMGSGTHRVESTRVFSSGKFYWEGVGTNTTNGTVGGRFSFCLSNDFADPESSGVPTFNAYWHPTAGLYIRGSLVGSTTQVNTNTYADGDVLAWAVDADNRVAYTYKNGVLNHTLDYSSYVSVDIQNDKGLTPHVWNGSSGTPSWEFNFGQKPFKYAPPQGFLSLNSATLRPETVITRPDQFVSVDLYTGTGSTRSINVNLKPDLVWIKNRNGTAFNMWFDTVRGATKAISSNHTLDEASLTSATSLTAFTDNGFTVATDGSVNASASNQTYVAWTWKAGGNKNTFNVDDVGYASAAAAGLDGGNKSPSGASVGTKQGFSILKFTNDTTSPITLSHGLTQAPTFVILKGLTGSVGWTVGHASIGFTKRLKLNTTDAESASANFFNNTAPTSTLITLGANNVSNDFIMYAWHDVPGLQKFGSYIGNESENGPFIELGFRPALLWIKRSSDGSNGWHIADVKRSPENLANEYLYADTSGAEETNGSIDILSNGFKLRANAQTTNNNATYIYCAWAEQPTFNLFGGQSNAR